nr:FtsW/RodA/SpoVE family cell cycle protein [Nocardioides insulae]
MTPFGFTHRSRRGAEAFLLVLALAVGIGAYLYVDLGVRGEFPPNAWLYSGWLVLLVLAAHVTIRLVAPYADPVLLPVAAALNGLGMAEIHRLDLAAGEDSAVAERQLLWMTVGIVLFIATLVFLRDHRVLQRYTYTCGLGAVVLLLLPMLPVIGQEINGARIWIHIGPLSFQPGEIAKILLVIAFAGYLVLHRDALALAGRRVLFVDLPRGRDLGPLLLMFGLAMLILVGQKDLGSSLLFFGIFVIMLYVATERPGWLIVSGSLFVAGLATIYALATYVPAIGKYMAHVKTRIDIWLHPFSYYGEGTTDAGRQLVEAMYGMAWGGLIGRGFGEGQPWRISYANSDMIIAAIGEELGLTAVIAILVCYGLFVERGLKAALISRDDFGKLLATGLAFVVGLQVFVIVGGILRLIPLTGLTTPFMSAGGSSLVANWVIVALLLRVSDQARRPLPDLQPTETPDDAATQVVKL